MDAEYQKLRSENIFLRLEPTHRMVISLVVGLVVFFCLPASRLHLLLRGMLFWDAFSYTLIILAWLVIATRSTPKIREFARREDGGNAYVFLVVLFSSFASMIMVALLILNKSQAGAQEVTYIIAAVAGMFGAWIIVHTTFTFHYAHLYYDDAEDDPHKHAEGLEFPSEKKPDYLDFAYFAFVIGMTFQVSDVEISSRKIRRLALLHGLLAFGLNTFVVALTVNLIAGLKA
ncbi:Uncharacterized membrane protein [Chitinophaga costaii]|uniref:Uncharacterized membrane protein n=1 Tax=Chitinophaga costaii TaxID=1335309 RepID=A0A1C4BLJ4_9BACT|nr:DUF1345 domain-containing protein [Chitinophaga costaii]PUZ27563.1 DUF1345 domain-containing protein [Chitinophaga costaii]SCC07608.1 Uncharacterized membrane protein [Chitinophaga costaii]